MRMQIVNGGGVEALLLDSVGRLVSSKYKGRVTQVSAAFAVWLPLLFVNCELQDLLLQRSQETDVQFK